jgi:hypothetical protein
MLDHNINHSPSRQPARSFAELRAADIERRTSSASERPNVVPAEKPSHDAIEFLRSLDPDGRHNLTALDPKREAPPEARTFAPNDWTSIADWIDKREGRLNLYFSVNEPAATAPSKKLSKSDISAVRALCIDIDIEKLSPGADLAKHFENERSRLRGIVHKLRVEACPPTAVLDSGGGIQAFWILSEKLDAKTHQAAAEAQGRGLIHRFGGDSVENVDRIMRLPGTTNIPTAEKVARGQQTRRASVTWCGARYAFQEVGSHYPPASKADAVDRNPEIEQLKQAIDIHKVSAAASFDELPHDLREKFELACAERPALARLWASGEANGADKSASAARFNLALRLKTASFSIDEFGALLFVWEHATSPHKPRIEEWDDQELRRELARCWANARAEPDPLDFFEEIPDDIMESPPKQTKPTKLLDLVSFNDAAGSALDHSTKPLIKGLLDEGALSVLYGESNVGKTFVAMDLAFHVATGMSWAERRTAQLGVVYVAAEGGQGARRRARALQQRFQGQYAGDPRFQFHLSGVNLRSAEADLVPLIETVRACEGVGLIVVDTLSRALAGGDENASTDMGALVKHIDHLRLQTKAHVMLVHHSGKERARGARGHSLLRAATDTEIEIADNEINVTKQRDLDGNFRRAFVLDRVELGRDNDGDPITSCVVRLVSHTEKPAGEPTDAEVEILSVLSSLHEKEASANGFKESAIVGAYAATYAPLSKEALRSRLRTMLKKRLVARPKAGLWCVRRDNLSDREKVEAWFEQINDDD